MALVQSPKVDATTSVPDQQKHGGNRLERQGCRRNPMTGVQPGRFDLAILLSHSLRSR
jgi:hypothetical protein